MNALFNALYRRRFALDRYRPLLLIFEVMMFLIGASFWVEARLQNQAFSEETWGRFALQYPAEFWAMIMMGQSAMIYVGLVKPIKRYYVALGAFVAALHFAVVAYSAIATGGQFVIGIYAIVLFTPIHAWMCMEALRGDA